MKSYLLVLVLVLAGGALGSLAAAANQEKTRQLLAVVQSNAELAERARALQQLALIAGPEAVPVVVPLLADDKLGQYARDVLEVMPDPTAGAALRAALGRLQGKALIGVVNSLGVRRDAEAVGALTRIAADSASAAAGPALLALGRIATPEAVRALQTALSRGTAEVRTAAGEAALLAAEHLLGRSDRATAQSLYDAVRQSELPLALRAAATRGAILVRDAAGLPLLLENLRSNERVLREVALLCIRELRGAQLTAPLVAELDRLAPPLQAQVIAALVARNEADSLRAIEQRAGAGEAEVRIAALQALGRIGRASSLPVLLRAAEGGDALQAAAVASLSRITAPEADGFILQSLPRVSPALRVRLIAVLGERQAASATPDLLARAEKSDPEERKAALRALGLVARPADLPSLLTLTLRLPDDDLKTLADRAIVTTSMKVLAPERRADAVVAAFRQAGEPATKAALLRPLGAIVRNMGGNFDAFQAVRPALKDASPPVRAAALSCLADWPDATPATTLLELVKGPEAAAADRETALRGALRMAVNVASGRERSPLNVREYFLQASRVIRTNEEKLLFVSSLGSLKRPEAIPLLQPYLEDPAVRREAALALVQIAPALAPRDVAAVRGLLERVAATSDDDDTRRKAARLAKGEALPATKAKGKGKAQPAASAPVSTQGRSPLFNGKDLGNWDGDPGVWRLRDGAIIGGSLEGNPRNEFLATTRPYRNFVLRLEYKLVGTQGFVNGGVQFRSVRIAQPPNEMSGYQADIGAGHSGSLYDESRRKKFLARAAEEQVKRLERPGDWNRYEIRCEGPRVELTLNGEKTVSYVEDDASVAPTGLIALQIHGNCQAEISFRGLAIDELP